jgi:hypothetical protein
MSTPDQLLRDLARARQHHLESLGGREAALVGELEGELVLFGRRSGRHLEDLHHGSILASPRALLLAVLACSFLAKRIEVAKLYHVGSGHDRLFRRAGGRS